LLTLFPILLVRLRWRFELDILVSVFNLIVGLSFATPMLPL